jgi:hypothetical protein
LFKVIDIREVHRASTCFLVLDQVVKGDKVDLDLIDLGG